jgi:two-component system, OmpR family, response regulator MprA
MQPPPRSVLVVDDDRHLCDILSELLSDAGYTVGCAHDGEEAWEEIQRRAPDIILSDVKMPRLDGIGLAARLASCGYATPIILMSAGHRDWTGVSATVIRKPFGLDYLLASLADILSRPTTRRADATA